jgi:FkbM family methyltransferase
VPALSAASKACTATVAAGFEFAGESCSNSRQFKGVENERVKSLSRLLLERLIARRPRRALQISCAHLGVCGVQLRLDKSSPLFSAAGGEIVELPIDDVIAPSVLDTGCWQAEELDFFEQHIPSQPAILLDIGANVGLITRQLMHRLPKLAAAVCFEPHPANFRLLVRNLAHLPQCHPVHAAVSAAAGELSFYEDVRNAGNYSLNIDAMRGRQYRSSVVRCVPAQGAELLGPLPPQLRDCPIIWKSDTQGSDELIVTSLPDPFWTQVHAGVMEISRIARPTFDADRLGRILSGFPVRHFGEAMTRNVAVEEILAFAQGRDGSHRDLFFARA